MRSGDRMTSTATARVLVDADGAGCETCNDLASMTMQQLSAYVTPMVDANLV